MSVGSAARISPGSSGAGGGTVTPPSAPPSGPLSNGRPRQPDPPPFKGGSGGAAAEIASTGGTAHRQRPVMAPPDRVAPMEMVAVKHLFIRLCPRLEATTSRVRDSRPSGPLAASPRFLRPCEATVPPLCRHRASGVPKATAMHCHRRRLSHRARLEGSPIAVSLPELLRACPQDRAEMADRCRRLTARARMTLRRLVLSQHHRHGGRELSAGQRNCRSATARAKP